MFSKCTLFFITIILSVNGLYAQKLHIEGYTYESNNRGYLNQVQITVQGVKHAHADTIVFSDKNGFFQFDIDGSQDYHLTFTKEAFNDLKKLHSSNRDSAHFIRAEMTRGPGYVFDVTLAPRRSSEEIPVEAISGSRIEIYNNTSQKQVLDLNPHPSPYFQFHFEDGNHYTVMIRKDGYLTKRLEAYVNIDGCIMCFDGIGDIQPGVSDNLHEGHEIGTFLANIELEPVEVGSKFVLENIYYDYNKSNIRADAAIELDKLIGLLKDNPRLEVELGSHTDARGKDDYNLRLSQKRAEAAVKYLVTVGGISSDRITSKGYGETELINRCANGIQCDEEEHQLNRRTELKVTGIREGQARIQSLEEIIRNENLLKEAMSDNAQVVVKEGADDIPEDLKAYIEKQKEQNIQQVITDLPKIPSDFSGYMILLEDDVSDLNKIENRGVNISNLYIYQEFEKRALLIGPYSGLVEANEALTEIHKNWNSSEVTYFENGRMKRNK